MGLPSLLLGLRVHAAQLLVRAAAALDPSLVRVVGADGLPDGWEPCGDPDCEFCPVLAELAERRLAAGPLLH